MLLKFSISILLLGSSIKSTAQEYIKVHFLYGSKPLNEYKESEKKWFGGKLGGHVGIEVDAEQIVSFVPKGKLHIFSHRTNRHSTFVVHSSEGFYKIFGDADSVKRAIIYIPTSQTAKVNLDSIFESYFRDVPYDYAFFGMRCGAATYEILAQFGVLDQYPIGKVWRKIFYPRKLRKRLFKKASDNGWLVVTGEGSIKRKWEKDKYRIK